MKKLNQPICSVPYINLHKNVVSSKHDSISGLPNIAKQKVLSLEVDITQRYDLFEQSVNQNTLFNLATSTIFNSYSDELLGCYKGRTSKVRSIFEIIKVSQDPRCLKRCPYCGTTLPRTHDHYLPESLFPELCLHALNLIPCCGVCNSKKGNNWRNNNHRTFIYFYSDVIPTNQYLFVDLINIRNYNVLGAKFKMVRPENINNNIWNVIDSHYRKLNLIERYNELVNDEISEVADTCASHILDGGLSISRFINNILYRERQIYGLNHWRVVLMESLSVNPCFANIVRSLFVQRTRDFVICNATPINNYIYFNSRIS